MNQKLRLLMMTLLCAVVSVAWGETKTITLSNQGYTNGQKVSSTTSDDVTLTYDKGTSSTDPAYYTTGTGVRVYYGGKMVVTANGQTITQVIVTFGKDGSPTISMTSNGTTTSGGTTTPATWKGSATEVYFNVSTKGHARIQKVEVTYQATSNDPFISVSPTTINAGSEGKTGELSITANKTNTGRTVTFYEANGTTSVEQPTWFTYSVNETSLSYSIAGNTGEARTLYFRVEAQSLSSSTEFIRSELVTVNQAKPFVIEDGIFNFAEYGYGMTQNEYNDATTLQAGNVIIKLKGTNNSRYWKNTDETLELRVYKACEMQVFAPAEKVIKSITFEGDDISKIQYEGNIISNGSWTGSQNEVKFTFSDTQKISKITVIYGDPSPTLTVNPTNITVPASGGTGSLTLSSTGVDFSDASKTVKLYTHFYSDENGINEIDKDNNDYPDWISINDNWPITATPFDVSYSVENNTEGERTAYIKLVYIVEYENEFGEGDNDEPIYSNVITITQEAFQITDVFELVTSTDNLAPGDQIIIVEEDGYYALSTNQKSNNRGATSVTESNGTISVTSSSDVQVITLQKNGVLWYFNTGEGYLYAASGSSNHLKTETTADDNGNASANIVIDNEGKAAITFQGTYSRNVLQFNYNNGSPLFTCYATASQDDVKIYRKVAPATPFTLTISELATDGTSYYATMSSLGNGNFKVPAGVEVSVVKLNENKKIVRNPSYEKGKVFAGDGAYLVEAQSAGTYVFEPTTEAVSYGISENWLYPTFANVKVIAPDENSYFFYQLSRNAALDENSVGFYWGKNCANGAPFKFSSDHKAYLAVPKTMFPNIQSASAITFDDNTDGINGITTGERGERGVYTLTGVRVDSKNLPKGIYIVDGKKQVVK